MKARRVRYRTASSSAKYVGFGLRIRSGTESTTVAGVLNIMIQKSPDSGIHLNVDEEQWRVTQETKRLVGEEPFIQIYLSGLLHIRCSSYTVSNLGTTVHAPDRQSSYAGASDKIGLEQPSDGPPWSPNQRVTVIT